MEFFPDFYPRVMCILQSRAKSRRSSTNTVTAETQEQRFCHIEGDYFRRDALHGPPLPRGYERRVTAQGN